MYYKAHHSWLGTQRPRQWFCHLASNSLKPNMGNQHCAGCAVWCNVPMKLPPGGLETQAATVQESEGEREYEILCVRERKGKVRSGVEQGQSRNFRRYVAFLTMEAHTRKRHFGTTESYLTREKRKGESGATRAICVYRDCHK